LDLGAGLNVQLGSATLAKAIDSRLLCGGILGAAGAACNPLLGAAPGTQTSDGLSTVEATGVAYGINAGLAYRPSTSTTISVGLRSATKYDLEGDVDFQHNAALITTLDGATGGNGAATLVAAGYGDRDITADLELPATASFAFATKMNPKLTLHGDVTWTDWSSVPEIRIVFPSKTGSQPLADSVTDLQWKDTVRVGAGVTYQMSDKTKLRAGVAYDPTPTPGSNNRTPRAPSSDTLWLSVGMGHKFNKKFSIDASLAYIKPEDTSITYTTPSATLNYLTRADVETSAISAALSLNYRFK
jgi:long-chain fatty acid transport protein